MKNKKEDKNLKNKTDELNLEELLEKKRKRKRRIIGLVTIIAIIIIGLCMAYIHYFGNYKYIRADIKISSSSKLETTNTQEAKEGALFTISINGIKRDDFLAQYEVLEISINDEKINLEEVEYRHLNKALSIRMYSEKYNVDEGNVVIITVKEKSSGQVITKRLYNTTQVI